MIKRKLFFSKRFNYDIWNLRFLVNTVKFWIYKDYEKIIKKQKGYFKLSIENKNFFLYFFKLNQKRKKFMKRKKKPFIYRIDLVQQRQTKKRWKKRYISLRLVKYFYSLLPYRYFRRISRIAKRKTGLYESNYLFLLEGRLVNFIYRTGIVILFLNLCIL